MKRTLVAQCAAAVLTGAAMVGANAVVTTPTVGAPVVIDGVSPATVLTNNTDGIGHILVVPYYSVQNNNDTYLSIVNHDMRNGKAVKVRFRGASNSDDVFDFTLLLSPGDVWSAAISKDAASGKAKLTVPSDKSCTLPNAISGQTFVTTRLAPYLTDEQKANETREGYIEILNMADIYPGRVPAAGAGDTPPDRVNAVAPAVNNPLFTAVKHVNSTPPGCAETAAHMVALFTDSTDYNLTAGGAVQKGLDVPTGGLSASWTVINVPSAAAYSGNADAIEARVSDDSTRPGYGNIVLFPQADTAQTVANARLWTADPLLRGAVADNSIAASGTPALPTAATSYVSPAAYDFPDLSTPYLAADAAPAALAAGIATKRQAARLTHAFAVSSVSNEFTTETGIKAKTDWVFTAATRRYNVARNYGTTATAATTVYTNYTLDDANVAIASDLVFPGINPQLNYYTPGNTTVEGSQICVRGISTFAGATTPFPNNRITGVAGDREENFVGASSQFVISPGTPAAPLTICGEASVLRFNNAAGTGVLGATVTNKNVDITVAGQSGWMRIATPGLTTYTVGGVAYPQGLPIVGSSFMELRNDVANGGSNYGIQFPHRTTRY